MYYLSLTCGSSLSIYTSISCTSTCTFRPNTSTSTQRRF